MSGEDTYGHTPVHRAFVLGDVYGIGYDEARAARPRIRLGLIGAGGVAQSKYFPAVARLRALWEPIEIVAFAEPRSQHARKVQEIYGSRSYADHEAMLEQEELDGVLVLGPDELHREHTLAALQSGCHVLVEKPIARSLVAAREMCLAADQRGLIMMTVATMRYMPPYRRAHAFIEHGPVSTPAMFVGKFNLGYDYVDLLESGTIHLFDLTRYLMGDVASVHALGVNRYRANRHGYPLDNAVASFRFTSGAIGAVYTSSSALSLKPWCRVEVYGNHAWLAVEDNWELVLYQGEENPTQSWKPAPPNTLLFDEEFGGFMGLIENFAQAIRGQESPLVSGWEGYHAYEVLSATQLSLARGSAVSLPLQPESADAEIAAWLQRERHPNPTDES